MANHQRSWTLPPSQKPVARLFIFHGTHEHCGKPCYAELAAAANARGIEAFAIDFHGHGLNTNGARGDFGPLDDAINEAVALVVKERGELPFAIFGHSLGSMVSFLAAHKLATDPSLPTPACVVLSGFAMDSVSPPFGVTALVPVLRAVPSVVRFVCAILSSVDPTGPACPLPPATELMRCPERAALTASDKLQYQGWIMNRTGVALLDARKRCNELLSEWGRHFPFLLIHGGADKLCPRSACDSLIAASPQMDKQLKVYEGYFHETLNDTKERRERVKGEVVQWLEERLQKGGPPIRSRL